MVLTGGTAGWGVVYDVDAGLSLPAPRRPLLRLQALLQGSPADRRSAWGMPAVLRLLAGDLPGAPVHYLTACPPRLRPLVERRLRADGLPDGTVVCTGRATSPDWVLGGRPERKAAAVLDLVERSPGRRWLLVGDDAGDDPAAFTQVARAAPDGVAAIAVREVRRAAGAPRETVGPVGVPVVTAPTGSELLPLLRRAAGLRPAPRDATERWLLTAAERGNDDARVAAWTDGNLARPLVDGAAYFPAVAAAVRGAGPGDLVLLLGWRADPDRRLDAEGATVAELLAAAARRGAVVRALLWRSHTSRLGYTLAEHRRLARAVGAAGGQVLLDQRVRPVGSHHQKLVVVRHRTRPQDDVAFLGGIDLARGRGDDPEHRGDAQPLPMSSEYGPAPAWHDTQLQLRGPAVADAETVFRERWEDRAPLTRLPWHTVPDRLHGLPRTGSPLPPPLPAPPAAGTCAVQLLRTYPRRHPAYPFARRGERSIARALAKALAHAERLVYLEDQYLWAPDVARAFASALASAPRLHLVAVVPRHPDQEGPMYRRPARLGHTGALAMIREAGGSRVQVLDVETAAGAPVYVHSKACVVDDVWASIGSDNVNTRSWTHDSELTAAVVDAERDDRAPADPGGDGDGARRFARRLRLDLLREHLDVDDDAPLLDPDDAAALVRERAAALDAWHAGGCRGERPPGRLRVHRPAGGTSSRAVVPSAVYRWLLDPDGRPLSMRLRRTY